MFSHHSVRHIIVMWHNTR